MVVGVRNDSNQQGDINNCPRSRLDACQISQPPRRRSALTRRCPRSNQPQPNNKRSGHRLTDWRRRVTAMGAIGTIVVSTTASCVSRKSGMPVRGTQGLPNPTPSNVVVYLSESSDRQFRTECGQPSHPVTIYRLRRIGPLTVGNTTAPRADGTPAQARAYGTRNRMRQKHRRD
jgi:hypothetical protein